MIDEVRPLRVLFKAAILFFGVNILFAWVNPPVGKLTLYNSLFPGRVRFPYEQEPQFYLKGFNAPIYEDFDAMFGAHRISQKKKDDEFRILFLGDSSTWSVSVQAEDTLAEQLNRKRLRARDGRTIQVYNLGYPMSFLMRDLLILDKAMEYEPDMIVWFVTLSTLESKRAETYFILPHADRYLRLLETYSLPSLSLIEPIHEDTFFDRTIVGRRGRLRDILFVQAMGALWAATGVDNHEGRAANMISVSNLDVEANVEYGKMLPEDDLSEYLSLLRTDIISAARAMAGNAPVVLINQPIFIASGLNSDVRYNDLYPRWVYDEYRRFLSDWTDEHELPYLDFWNALPPADFADSMFHRNRNGEKEFADMLAPQLQRLTRP
ncbi:MAG: hypothetical protein B6D38_01000 [Anaerolineae bacterium UTCFX1]|jgi:hypothetical protein|nr:MAG: hypothetical protein B6D38_01000 [Anaerolineae bacterium UTCFX1]